MKRKVCVVTGSRADYGILYPIMKVIESSNDLSLFVIVTGMHLMREFGYTVKKIENDGFNIFEKIDISYKEDTGKAMAIAVGKAVDRFSKSISKLSPDFVVVLGDRGEMLAAAISANYMNIPVVHIHGGEISGHVDGIVRHAITKLSHIHFTATKKAANRISKLGEERNRIFTVGAPALDCILGGCASDKKRLLKRYNITEDKHFAILVQHPVLTQMDDAGRQIAATMDAINQLKLQTIVIYPNCDAGGRKMIEIIRRYERLPFIKSFKSLPHEDYLGLMKIVSVLIGNSSSGIIEAASYKIPVVNIGVRQCGRERSTNVIDAAHDKDAIIKAIKKALYDKEFKQSVKTCRNPYGDGLASKRIVEVLSRIGLGSGLLQKQITY